MQKCEMVVEIVVKSEGPVRGHIYHPLGVPSSRPGVTKTAEFLGVPAVFFERLARWLFFGRLIPDLVGLL